MMITKKHKMSLKRSEGIWFYKLGFTSTDAGAHLYYWSDKQMKWSLLSSKNHLMNLPRITYSAISRMSLRQYIAYIEIPMFLN